MAERWRVLWVLSAARIAMGFQFQSIGSTAPMLRDQFDLALADIGWLVGLYLLPGLVIALPGGLLSARLGDRRIAITGMALMAAGGAVCAWADGVGALQAGRLVAGVGGVLFNVTATKMIADWFAGREIGLAMALFMSTWPIGIGLALMSLGIVAELASPAAAFALTAALAGVCLLLIVLLYRPAPGSITVTPLRIGLLGRRAWLLLAVSATAWMAYNVALALIVSFMPTLLAARGVGVAGAGATTAIFTVATIASIQLCAWLIERVGYPMAIASAGLIIWALSLVPLLGDGSPLPWLLLGGVVSGAATGLLASAPARFLEPGARAVGLGIFYTLYYLGMAVLPRAVGRLADATGSTSWILGAAIAALLVALALMWATHGLMRAGEAAAARAQPG